MKLAKSLFLGSAAGLMAVAGANAADLPVRAAAPAVDYVRVCSAYGTGFFFIPGTDTCLRVSGFVRADYVLNDTRRAPGGGRTSGQNARAADAYNFLARARMNFDSRTGTEYGLLRTFTSIDYNAANGAGNTGINVINAYVQFGGITAGRIQSFFMYRWAQAGYGPFFQSTNLTYGNTNVLAYTATFGQGISATIALEDGNRRAPGIARGAYAGREMPDLVANLNISQGWGSARLAGALHQIRSQNNGTKYGWAALAGVEFNLPALAPGSLLWLQATYADGASNYSGGANDPTRLGYVSTNAYVLDNGTLRTTKTWALSAGLRHFWTPQLQSNVHFAYVNNSFSTLGRQQIAAAANWDAWNIGKSLIWSPVAGLAIGVEGQYAQVRGTGINAARVITTGGAPKRTDDIWTARLRIQRDF